MKISKQQKAALESYARSALGAVIAVVATGNYSPSDLGKAAVAALIPPALRWANSGDPAFRRKIVRKKAVAKKK
jgi:hypothetical protein